MSDPKSDPRRRCMKLELWPSADRAAWQAAITGGGLLDVSGLAARWRETSRKAVMDSYGRYLTFLELNGWLDRDAAPAARMSPEWLRAFIAELEQDIASVTLRNRITNLSEALRVMAPNAEFPYLRRARTRLKARASPARNKRRQIVPIRDLFQLGVDLISRAEHDDIARDVLRAALYRDGLIILVLACRPIRRSNVAAMIVGRHLVKRGDAYTIVFEDTETKARRQYEQPLHAALTPIIDRYLDHFRPQLLGASVSERLWISWRSQPMTDCVVYASIIARTTAAFGVGVPPHRFRDCAVTSLSEDNPELIWIAQLLLHHADPRIAEKQYNQARNASAIRDWQEHVTTRRRVARRRTAKSEVR